MAAKIKTFLLVLMSELLNNEKYRNVSSNKQDCERNAFYRLAVRIKKRFPKQGFRHMDGLYACGPVIQTCRDRINIKNCLKPFGFKRF